MFVPTTTRYFYGNPKEVFWVIAFLVYRYPDFFQKNEQRDIGNLVKGVRKTKN